MNRYKDRLFYTLVLICGVVLTSLSFPAKSLWFGFLGWICFVPLIYWNEKLETGKIFIINSAYFLLSFLAIFWVNPLVEKSRFYNIKTVILLAVLYILIPLTFAAAFTFFRTIAAKFDPHFRPVVYAGLWVSLEFILAVTPFSLPLSIAVTQAQYPALIQFTPWLGIYGVSFLLMGINSAFAISLSQNEFKLAKIAVAVFIINIIFGQVTLAKLPAPVNQVKIGLVQPNVNWQKSLYARSSFFQNIFLNQLCELSQNIKARWHPALIVWPELSADCYLLQDRHAQVNNFVRNLKVPLLLGTRYFDSLSNQPNNIAALISDSGMTTGIYRKSRLFPFIETPDFKAGDEPYPLAFDRGINNIGALLCFESLSPQVPRQLTLHRGNVLILLANGSWFGQSRWPWLHLSMLVFRALENRRWAIHLNNTGPSAVISPQGMIDRIIPEGKTSIALAKVEPGEETTFYARTDELFPKVICFLSLGLIFWPKFRAKGGGGSGGVKRFHGPDFFGGESKC
jgi:apolipoprotein N-acyltransferase